MRTTTSGAVVDAFLAQNAEVAAGVKQQLEADAARVGGVRLLPGRFMVIEQAMGLPASRGDAGLAVLAEFVEHKKASGFVAAALARHRIQGAARRAGGTPLTEVVARAAESDPRTFVEGRRLAPDRARMDLADAP